MRKLGCYADMAIHRYACIQPFQKDGACMSIGLPGRLGGPFSQAKESLVRLAGFL